MLGTAGTLAQEYFLDNGLKVVLIPLAGTPVASVLVLYRIGARNEAVGYTGSAHLLEHMLFKGTPANNRGNGRGYADIMNEIGATKNASTCVDRTTYYETVPSGYVELAIELEADRMRNAFIDDADRRAEMTIVRNELERIDNNPMLVLEAALAATAFREHPYHHPTIGWRSDVENVSTQRLRELYDTFYHPDNATVVIAGGFDTARTRDAIERSFGALARAAREIPGVYTSEPPQAGERRAILKRPGDAAIVGFGFHTPAALGQTRVLSGAELAQAAADGTPESDASAVLDVLGGVLGGGRSSRLSRALVDSGLALDVSASNWGTRDPGLFQIMVDVRPGAEWLAVRDELTRALEAIVADGPEAEEVARAQSQIAVARSFGRDGPHALAQRLADMEAVGSWRLDERYFERIAAVTPDRVREVAAEYLHEDNRSIAMLVPGTPKTFDFEPSRPAEERATLPAPIETVPVPEPRGSYDAGFAARIAGARLANDLRWKFVEARGTATVHVRGLIEAGPALSIDRPMLPALVAAMLSRGTLHHPRPEIEARLERAGIRRSYRVDDVHQLPYDPVAFRFSAACVARDLHDMLISIAEELREPAFDPAEFELVKGELAGALRKARSDTAWRAMARFSQLAYEPSDSNHERDVDSLLADIDATTLDEVWAFYTERVSSSAPIVSAAGGTSDERFRALLEESLGSIRFTTPAPQQPAPHPRPAAERRENVALERKANADIVMGRATPLVASSPDYLAASVANGMLGESKLSSRLALRVREREGLTYRILSAFLSAGRLPGPWRITLSVNPANVERAIALVREVLRDYAEAGPTPREIAQQRNAMAGGYAVALATNAELAMLLERITYLNVPQDFVDTYRARLEAISDREIREAIPRYFGADDLIVVAAGTER